MVRYILEKRKVSHVTLNFSFSVSLGLVKCQFGDSYVCTCGCPEEAVRVVYAVSPVGDFLCPSCTVRTYASFFLLLCMRVGHWPIGLAA